MSESENEEVPGLGDGVRGRDGGRGMVAPATTPRARLSTKNGPRYSGKRSDWDTWSFQALAFLSELGLEETTTGQDERASSEDQEENNAWLHDNVRSFNVQTRMIDNNQPAGNSEDPPEGVGAQSVERKGRSPPMTTWHHLALRMVPPGGD